MLTDKQIQENWDKFREIINTTFTGERKDRLNEMYDFFEDRIVFTPAAGREHFHNAFPGGYLDHVLRVIDLANQFYDVWEKNGAVEDFSKEELVFSAMHHDLGKVGDLRGDYYIPNESQWHREKQGLIYKFNEKIHHMTVSDRTCWLLNNFGIKYSQVEWLGIRCTDGLYESENETYLKQSEQGRQIKTNIVFILHQADLTAARLEYLKWKNTKSLTNNISNGDDPVMFKKTNIGKISNIVEKNNTNSQKQLFEDLFK